jgi:signal transduction histidine kinase/DNA-binding response OmpR family regulator
LDRYVTETRLSAEITALLDVASEGFAVVSATGGVRLLSAKAEALLGLSADEVLGHHFAGLRVPQLVDALETLLKAPPEEPTSLCFMFDGMVLHCVIAGIGEGASDGLIVVIRDDTRHLAQREHSEAVLAGAGDGFVVFSADREVTYVNPAAVELLGDRARRAVGKHITLAELLGLAIPESEAARPCWEILECGKDDCPEYGHGDLRCWLRCSISARDGEPIPCGREIESCAECDVYKVNTPLIGELDSSSMTEVTIDEPEHRVLEVRTSPVIDPAGRRLGCVSTLHDVTAEREAAIMKNEFVSMVSHELRTPLTSIKGYVDLIVDGEAGEINEIQREFLEIVQENSDRLVSLINDMLDISRIESGRVHLRIEPLEVPDIIQGVLDTFRTWAAQSDIGLAWKVAQRLPRIAGDRDRVGQVLMNLVSNAIKYSPGGGTVTVEAHRKGNCVAISVTDTGIGISPEDVRQLFTKFFRVDSSLTREIGGTGLGLSIVKSVIELMGGTVSVKSREGEGSTFAFTVPIAPVDLVRTPRVEGPLEAGTGTVLVVDHDPDIADLIETYLVRRGYDVLKATTGAQARELARKHTPCLITLDVMLDDADGFDLLQELTDDPLTAAIPVVVLSIVCDEGKSLRLGAADYLEKPIDQKRLVSVIDGLIGAKDTPLVLVADDDRYILDALSRTLRRKGFAVSQARDGSEALAAVEARKPDLILLDLRMPRVDGYQVIQEIKSRDETKDIPIVVMTAHRIDNERIDILKLAAEHVSKPFSAEQLIERVEEVLGGGGCV